MAATLRLGERRSPSLKWLVDRRARLAYQIKYETNAGQSHAQQAEASIKKVSALKNDLAAFDRALSMHEICIRPQTIAQKTTWRAGQLFPHGPLTRNLPAYLRKARGRWVRSHVRFWPKAAPETIAAKLSSN